MLKKAFLDAAEWLGFYVASLAVLTFSVAITAWLLTVLWNEFAPAVFEFGTINFRQAAALLLTLSMVRSFTANVDPAKIFDRK